MRNIQIAWLAAITIGLCILPACGDDTSTPTEPNIPTTTLAQLRSAPESLGLAGQEYRLEAYLWRDFMPIAPPDGQPMTAIVRLVEQNQQPIPGTVKLVHLWVINGTRVWSTELLEPTPYSPDYVIERIARDGPKWGPGIEVDVVVGLRIDESFRLIRAPQQMINRTD